LVGDAAHAMSPSMAPGVGLAVEDALVLAETLAAFRSSRHCPRNRNGGLRAFRGFVRRPTDAIALAD
jgi:2-polyprenyl-6-methoxyphenol hydroxylase-like FAD-dependent oxidoreductase